MEHVSNGFQVFMKESGPVGSAYMEAVAKMSEASALDHKTAEKAWRNPGGSEKRRSCRDARGGIGGY